MTIRSRLGLGFAAAVMLVAPPMMARAEMTGTSALDACRRQMLPSPPGYSPAPHELVLSGRCIGVIDAIIRVGRSLPPPQRNCAPMDGSTAGLQVVVQYMVGHRDRLGEPFVDLVTGALAEKWPCPVPK